MKIYRSFIVFLAAVFMTVGAVKAQTLRDADNDFRNCKYEKALEEYKKVSRKSARTGWKCSVSLSKSLNVTASWVT